MSRLENSFLETTPDGYQCCNIERHEQQVASIKKEEDRKSAQNYAMLAGIAAILGLIGAAQFLPSSYHSEDASAVPTVKIEQKANK